MSILDELKKMTRPYDEDEEYMDDEEFDGYEEQPAFRVQPQTQTQPVQQVPVQPVQPVQQEPVNVAPAVDNIFGGVATAAPDITRYRVMLVQPEDFDCATAIGDALRKGDAIILNCENTPADVARRVVDFLSGVAYALDGDIKKAADKVYILAPSDVGVDAAEAEDSAEA